MTTLAERQKETVTIKEVELKAIKYIASMSEETPCFDSNLYINGKKVGNVSNRGCGGENDIHLDIGCGYTLQDLERYASNNVPDDYDPTCSFDDKYRIEFDFDMWIARQVTNHNIKKDIQRLKKKKILFVGKDKQLYTNSAAPTKENIAKFKKTANPLYVLNELDTEKAIELYRKFG